MRKASDPLPPKPIAEQGKIYIKDNLLFVNEKYKGIHVFDNSNPASPLDRGFIRAPGTTQVISVGASLARFIIFKNQLYALNNNNNRSACSSTTTLLRMLYPPVAALSSWPGMASTSTNILIC